MKIKKFEKILKISYTILFIILASGCTTINKAEKNQYEVKIQIADEVYKNNDFQKSLIFYNALLEDVQFKNKYLRAVILFRIADIQKETGDIEGIKKTALKLDKLRKLFKLPYYYNKKIDSLLFNTDFFEIKRTIIPESKIVFEIYISSSGDDNSDGTKDYPLKTFDKAIERIREKRNIPDLEKGALKVTFLDNYYIEKSISLTEIDSGTKENPLIISGGSSNDRIVVSGEKKIINWRKLQSSDTVVYIEDIYKNKILAAGFEENNIKCIETLTFGGFCSGRRFKTHNIPQLFYSGITQKISSWPNNDYTSIEINERFTNDRIMQWAGEKDAWLHGYWKYTWADAYEKIEKIDKDKRIISLAAPLNICGFRDPQVRVVNAVSEIDEPGEWAVDTEKGLIFYYPDGDFEPDKAVLSYSTGGFVIENCSNVKIENLDIRYIRGDIINIKDSENIIIFNSCLSRSSGDGLVITGSKNHTIYLTEFKSLGRGGINITTGDWRKLKDSETVIENCKFSDLSIIDRTYTPGIRIEGMNQVIRNNEFYNLPSSAIRLETNNARVELNKFYNCVYESGDQGVIDVWGNPIYRGNIIRWNYFKDIVNEKHYAASVRLDDAISGYSVCENIFSNASSGIFGTVQINGGKNNLIEGNLIYNCSIAFSKITWSSEKWENYPGVIKSLEEAYWQNDSWTEKYPYLSGVGNKYKDENYYIDNTIINSAKIFRGSFDTSLLFNNIEIITKNIENLYDRKIPVEKIGNY